MFELSNLWLALLLGMAGSSHCLAMCGGISCAIGLNSPSLKQDRVKLLLSFNFGRICSYALAGLALGSLSYGLFSFHQTLLPYARMLAALLLLAMALHFMGWWQGISQLERNGQRLWRYIAHCVQLSLPLHSWQQGLALGLIWGWLPCGLIYSTLSWAVLAEHPLQAAAQMLAFGIGTLPMMFLVGFFSGSIGKIINHKGWRYIMAALLFTFAFWTFYTGWSSLDHATHNHH